MHNASFRWIAAIAALLSLSGEVRAQEASPATEPVAPATTTVILQTTLGEVRVALETERAPITSANFLKYVDEKRLDGTTIYRAVKIGDDGIYGLVQGGVQGDRKRTLPPIAHESPAVTGVGHVDGTISMARGDPGSATADFFFVLGDLRSLDGSPANNDPGYAAFGHVTAGLDVVRAVLDLPRSETADQEVMKGQMLAQPVKIVTVRRAEP
ncbi:MAG: peptidylprolyl isomerase [Steroidobacteraceae bacterium]